MIHTTRTERKDTVRSEPLPLALRAANGRPANAAAPARRRAPAAPPPETPGTAFVVLLCLMLLIGFVAIGALAYVAFTPSPTIVAVP